MIVGLPIVVAWFWEVASPVLWYLGFLASPPT